MRLLLSLSLAVGVLILAAIAGRDDKRAEDRPPPTATTSKATVPRAVATETVATVTPRVPDSPLPTKSYLYRWRDANGTIHIQSTPPPPGHQAVKIAYDKDQPRPPADPEQVQAEAGASSSVRDRVLHPLSVYTPKGFEQLLDTVEETATKLQQRDQALDKLRSHL